MLPPLPKHGGDRNRTSPFAFTGNKFEFRALGSSMSLAFPNTVLNTIVAEAIDELADKLEAKTSGGMDAAEAVIEVVKESYSANKAICFDGDNYSEEWHAEAEQRGLKNLRTTPDALLEVIAEGSVEAFEKYSVLSKRELESRFEVWIEQYALRANIEAETTFSIAKTMILPAAMRHLALIEEAGVAQAAGEVEALVGRADHRARRAREGQRRADRAGGPGAGDLRPRRAAGQERRGPQGGRQAGEDRRRRPLAAAEVRGDAVHQVAGPGRSRSGVPLNFFGGTVLGCRLDGR